jgi:L-asparaginase II/putative methionine-R-sulfoxide reductase with GAF domain
LERRPLDNLVVNDILDGPPTVALTRGDGIESVHRVAWCVADESGRVLESAGTLDIPVFLRSAAKPFIAGAIVASGAAQRFGFDGREIAVMTGSHNGEAFHVAAVGSMLQKMGLSEDALLCGPHLPYDEASAHSLLQAGGKPRAIHNNCSGKHAGILALGAMLGAPIETYLDRNNPVQEEILTFCARICGVDLSRLTLGVDGCGIPVFAVPLPAGATAFARLATLRHLSDADANALHIVRDAMIAHPEYVGGTGEFDTALMQAAGGSIAAKSGAEGVHGMAAIAPGLGALLKTVDGNGRAVPPAAMDLARRAKLVESAALDALRAFAKPEVCNRSGRIVGDIEALPVTGGAAYDLLESQARALLDGEPDLIANAANIAALAYEEIPDINWAGFYFMHDDGTLVLGPFGGRPACTRLAPGRGVCGAAAARGETLVVDDVRAFADHIACDSASRSEIVVPLFEGRRVRGVLDIDSPSVGRFNEADRRGIEALARAFSEAAYG